MESVLKKCLFSVLPFHAQNLIISVVGYKWKKRRFGGVFERELQNYKAREQYSIEKWTQYQTTELRDLVIHAYENVPFYYEKFSKVGVSKADLLKIDLDHLFLLPNLSKDELRKFGKTTLISKKCSKNGLFFPSSGSTGTPINILFSRAMHQRWSAAFEARIRNWAGVTYLDSRGMIGGRRIIPEGISQGPYYRYNSAEKQIYFSAYHISSSTVRNYAYALKKYSPSYMTGYAMSNYILALYFLEAGIEVPQLKAVITSSEKLTGEMRDVFQKVYGCKTYDSYSGIEACGLISENEFGQLLISPDVGIMEVLNDEGKPCQPGEEGEIYSTGFLNYDQPLIRYKIGDRVRLSPNQKTLCGRNMVVVDEIIGRTEDIIQGPDGRRMVRFHGLYLDIKGLMAGQIIQHSLSDFTIRLQVENALFNKPESEKLIRQRLNSQLGFVKIDFEYPDKIQSGPNGKFKAVISELPLS